MLLLTTGRGLLEILHASEDATAFVELLTRPSELKA
jgi:hypothetical protein